MKHYEWLAEQICNGALCILEGRKTATFFFKDLKHKVRVTRRGKSKMSIDMVVIIGKPNYIERQFLKLCSKAKTRPRNPWFGSMKEKPNA